MTSRCTRHAWILPLLLLTSLCLAICAQAATEGEVRYIDPFGTNTRNMPNVLSSGTTPVPSDRVIDVVILGDGYTDADSTRFWNDAQNWYIRMIGWSGIHPLTQFEECFRVRAVWHKSATRCAAPSPDTYYGAIITRTNDSSGNPLPRSGSTKKTGWKDQAPFQDGVSQSLSNNITGPSLDFSQYPWNLDVQIPLASGLGDTTGVQHSIAGTLRNVNIVFLAIAEDTSNPSGNPWYPSGHNTVVEFNDPNFDRIAIGFGVNSQHEFGHSFANLEDEYRLSPNQSRQRTNPTYSARSIYRMTNLSFTDSRNGVPWGHLAPGGSYNPTYSSLEGSAWYGGENDPVAFHSEYMCLMNGKHSNSTCSLDPVDSSCHVDLRNFDRLCLWCEEIATIRILEKTGELERVFNILNPLAGGLSPDPNIAGRELYDFWTDDLRDIFYQRFDIPQRIANRRTWPGTLSNPVTCGSENCPDCMSEFEIRSLPLATYFGSGPGTGQLGTRADPISIFNNALNALGGTRKVLIVQPDAPASQLSSARVINTPSILISGSCDSVVLGK